MKQLNATEKKLIIYTSLLIAVLFNIFKLLALRENVVVPRFWKFNAYELLFQAVWNFLFCLFVGFITLKIDKKKYRTNAAKTVMFILFYATTLVIIQAVGVNVQKRIFLNDTPLTIFRALYFARLFSSLVLVIILLRLFRLLDERKIKQHENEQLRNAYLSAQLQILKEQLNPHFFFNTLSSLSAVVREDPKKAQQYIAHLSKIFHYSLDVKNKSLVTIKEELAALDSYIQLIKMRFENNVIITIHVEEKFMKFLLPHMSLQPLIENAIKHNAVFDSENLNINICSNNNMLEIRNNTRALKQAESSTGIGLANLNERYKILMQQEISIQKNKETFTVLLPLKANA